MATYKTPGVYVREISKLPPSVAEVSTAIPAFIGCTKNGPAAGEAPIVKRIDTMLEYETEFGGANPSQFGVAALENNTQMGTITRTAPTFEYLLYYCLSLYFKNGGGSCYVISVGNYEAAPGKQQFLDGLTALGKEDEPTLILLTEAVNLNPDDYYEVAKEALAQCKNLGDRFAILDVLPEAEEEPAETEGTEEGTEGEGAEAEGAEGEEAEGEGAEGEGAATEAAAAESAEAQGPKGGVDGFRNEIGTDGLMYGAAYYPNLLTSLAYVYDDTGVTYGSGTTAATLAELNDLTNTTKRKTALYSQIKTALAGQRVILPPSAAIAGVYARVDRDRGVWKAPANVSLSAVIGPTVKITDTEQENLNVDETAGKSINAIRAFTGKGILVWGARTLAGNDNEWRYVSVRRLFNMIEESTRKATGFAVFEPNDATTWLKVKGMIESYLYGLWQRGALAGSTAEQAYFVNVGLGKTMTPQDILEGIMIVEMGLAAVRPAEFIILRFMHKLQQA